jgi:hypothetical protein
MTDTLDHQPPRPPGKKRRVKSRHPISALPFVSDRQDGQPGRCFWNGAAGANRRLGQEFGLAYLRYEASQDHNVAPLILPWIVADMPRPLGPAETEFMTVVAIAAATGLDEAERVVAYWASQR